MGTHFMCHWNVSFQSLPIHREIELDSEMQQCPGIWWELQATEAVFLKFRQQWRLPTQKWVTAVYAVNPYLICFQDD